MFWLYLLLKTPDELREELNAIDVQLHELYFSKKSLQQRWRVDCRMREEDPIRARFAGQDSKIVALTARRERIHQYLQRHSAEAEA
jgi:hypothetical protein